MDALSEPVIGICAVRERARWSFWDYPAHLVADSYVASVQRTGAIAVLALNSAAIVVAGTTVLGVQRALYRRRRRREQRRGEGVLPAARGG